MKVFHIAGGKENDGASLGAKNYSLLLEDFGHQSSIRYQFPLRRSNNFLTKFFNLKNHFYSKLDKIVTLFTRDRQLFSLGVFGLDLDRDFNTSLYQVVNIHWFNGYLSLSSILKSKSNIVLTLRDYWLYTGGCHSGDACSHRLTGCRSCPIVPWWLKFLPPLLLKAKLNALLKSKIKITSISKLYLYQLRVLLHEHSRALGLKSPSSIDSRLSYIPNIADNCFYQHPSDSNYFKSGISANDFCLLAGAKHLFDKRKQIKLACNIMINEPCIADLLFLFGISNPEFDSISASSNGKIILLGEKKNPTDMLNVYGLAHCFLSLSLSEIFGKTSLEALLCGIPVICLEGTGTSEMITHKKNGYILRDFSANSLVEAIYYIKFNLNSHQSRDYIRDYSYHMFSREDVLESLLNTYDA